MLTKVKPIMIDGDLGGNESSSISNLGISVDLVSVANSMTITLTQKDGSPITTGSGAVKLSMPVSTSTTKTYETFEITSPVSYTITSGSTLGHLSGLEHGIYIYVVKDGTTPRLAVSQVLHSEHVPRNTVSGSGNTNNLMYSTASVASATFRVVGKILSTQTTAGLWATPPSRIILGDYASLSATENIVVVARNSSGQNILTNTRTTLTNWTTTINSHNIFNPSSGVVTIPLDGFYEFSASASIADTLTVGNRLLAFESVSGGAIAESLRPHNTTASGYDTLHISPFVLECTTGQELMFRYYQDSGTNLAMDAGITRNWLSVKKVGSNV